MNAGRNCDGPFIARYKLCNDWNVSVKIDNYYGRQYVTEQDGTTKRDPKNDNLIVEIEQWQIPQGYRPEPGDRIYLAGRLVADCGEDWHTEIHPPDLLISSYTQTGQLIPSIDIPSFGTDKPVFQSTEAGTVNLPPITQEWPRLKLGVNQEPFEAVIHKVVLTGAVVWGGSFSFDLYPSTRPSPNERLHWIHEANGGTRLGNGVHMSITPEPFYNPNHLRVTINVDPSEGVGPFSLKVGKNGDVYYENDLRIADSFLLWWDY